MIFLLMKRTSFDAEFIFPLNGAITTIKLEPARSCVIKYCGNKSFVPSLSVLSAPLSAKHDVEESWAVKAMKNFRMGRFNAYKSSQRCNFKFWTISRIFHELVYLDCLGCEIE